MLSATLGPAAEDRGATARAAIFASVILCCGLIALIALTRTGIRTFWSGGGRQPPVVRPAEALPVVVLLALCGLRTVAAGPAMRLAHTAARALRDRGEYVDAVLHSKVTAPAAATDGSREGPR
jgi:multicomponent K+:H+ antiporter subunit D